MTRRTLGLLITSALARLLAPLATAAPPAGKTVARQKPAGGTP